MSAYHIKLLLELELIMWIINDDKEIISVELPLIVPPLNSFEKRFLLPTGTPIYNTNKTIMTSTPGLVFNAKINKFVMSISF